MSLAFHVRPEQFTDHNRITQIHRSAFGRDQEGRLVHRLRRDNDLLLSLVAEMDDGRLVGHIAFSPSRAEHGNSSLPEGVALGPLAIMPRYQKRGIGRGLVEQALIHQALQQFPWVVVVGAPHYYTRFGFVAANPLGLRLPFSVPPKSFMVRWSHNEAVLPKGATIHYHSAFLSV